MVVLITIEYTIHWQHGSPLAFQQKAYCKVAIQGFVGGSREEQRHMAGEYLRAGLARVDYWAYEKSALLPTDQE